MERFALLVVRQYLDLPDPDAQPRDDEPEATKATVAALQAIAGGHIDLQTTNPDALDPYGRADVISLLGDVTTFSFAGRATMKRPLRMHGHLLVGFTIVKLTRKTGTGILTVYRDDSGKIAYVEGTQ